ncbi:TIGR03936 family radical SAM-associated protein [Elusimicrobiota bacterium]
MMIFDWERELSMVQRPSQYIGWEIGSNARYLLDDSSRYSARIVIFCPQPYYKAMSNRLVTSLYKKLSVIEGLAVERMFLPEESLRGSLRESGFDCGLFTLETKSPAASADVIICVPDAAACDETDKLIKAVGREKVIPIDSQEEGRDDDIIAMVAKKTKKDLKADAQERAQRERAILPYCAHLHTKAVLRNVCGYEAQMHSMGGHAAARVGEPVRYRMQLKRHGLARFLSHLEQIQVIKAAIIKSSLPLAYSGKQLKPRMSFGPAVSVGWESDVEYADYELTVQRTLPDCAKAIAKVLPHGFSLAEIKKIPRHFPSLEESLNQVEFHICSRGAGVADLSLFCDAACEFLGSDRRDVTVRKEKSKGRVEVVNVKDVLCSVKTNGGSGIIIKMGFGPKRNLKPERVLETLGGFSDDVIKSQFRITRTSLALDIGDGRVRYP